MNTPKGKLDWMMHSAIWFACKKQERALKKKIGWRKIVNYDSEQLKLHIANQFKKGMSWKKYLSGEIHIDHRIPKSWFNYESFKEKEFQLCWSLENLQPMWGKENLAKNNFYANPSTSQLSNPLIQKVLDRRKEKSI